MIVHPFNLKVYVTSLKGESDENDLKTPFKDYKIWVDSNLVF